MGWVSVLGTLLIMALGCDEVTDEEDIAASQALADSAIGVFEDELASFIDSVEAGTIDSPYEIDFTTSNAIFKEALTRDAYNLDANFGAGLTELLIFTQNPDFKAVFDAWETFVDTGSIFVAGELSKSRSPLSIFRPGGSGAGSFQLLNKREVAATFLSMPKMAVSDPPTIGDIQDIVESLFIPTLDYIADRLEILDDSTDFTFTITSAMQGGDETAKELDLTEIYLLETGVHLLLAFSNGITAYNVGPSAYDSAAIIGWLSQGSGIMSLRSSGADRMGNAKTALLTAANKLDAATNFLEADTDTANDIIKLTAGELTADDLDSVRYYTQEFRDMFDTGISFTEDWDDSLGTPDEELTFDFDVLFTNPIVDFKSILPVYTVEVGRDTGFHYQWIDTTIVIQELIINPSPLSAPFWFYLHYEYYDDWDSPQLTIEHNFPDIGIDYSRFYVEADSLMDDFMARSNIRSWNIRVDWNQTLLPDSNDIFINVWAGYDLGSAEGLYYTGIITFAAETADDWTFQVENLNGLLALGTLGEFSSDDLKRLVGFRDSDFEQTLIIPFDFGGGMNKALSPGGFYGLRRSALAPWAFVK